MGYSTIIWDLSEVIVSGYYGSEHTVERLANIPSQEFRARREELNPMFMELMRGKVCEMDYFDIMISGTGWNIKPEHLREVVWQNLNHPVEGTLSILKSLLGRFKLILVSDYVKSWAEYMEKQNPELLMMFDKIYFSCDTGLLKQDKGLFSHVLLNSEIVPNQAIFVDDFDLNVQTASTYGINSVLFYNAESLRSEFYQRFGIRV